MFFTRRNIGRRSIVFKWLVSYVLVLLIPILVSAFIYRESIRSIENEINRANESLLMQVQQSLDSRLREVRSLSTEIALNSRVADFVTVEKPLSNDDRYKTINIIRDIRVYKAANDFVDSFFIYYQNSDTVLGTGDPMNGRALFDVVKKSEDMNFAEWEKFLWENTTNNFVPVVKKEANGKYSRGIAYMKPISVANLAKPEALILCLLNESRLLEDIKNIPLESDSTVVVLDNSNQRMAVSGKNHLPFALEYGELVGNSGMIYAGAGSQKVAISYVTSQVVAWKYVTITDAGVFWERAEYIRRLIYLSIALCLIAGGLATYFSVKLNYSPVSKLLHMLTSRMGSSFDRTGNEYRFIEEAITATWNEKEAVSEKLRQQNNAFKQNFLAKLLKGRPDNHIPLHEALQTFDIQFNSEYFGVLLFFIDDFSGLFDEKAREEPTEKIRLLHFIISNVAEELTGRDHKGYVAEVDEMLACLVNIKKDGKSVGAEEMVKIALEAQQFLQEKFKIQLTVSVSGIHSSMDGIAQAYQEAWEAMEYRLVMGSGRVISHEQLKNSDEDGRQCNYYYPLQLEQQLVNLIKTGDFEKAQSIVEDIYQRNFPGSFVPLATAKCLMFDIISTMVKVADELDSLYKENAYKELNPAEDFMECETIHAMKKQIENKLWRLCDFVNQRKKGQSNRLTGDIETYIYQKYADPNLSIVRIGDTFEMTPSYLSRLFKDQTGQGLLEYIHRIRIENAKLLLKEQSCTIQEVASKVGYSDTYTFSRVFKKIEGITPGKYKGI